ncbi:MAG: DUF2203 family protein [Deltaproteobacteria bacterium]|nr:DUF2203 family protein [Deltaproteobacteria bacterium]
MAEVFQIKRDKIFTLEEARHLLPLVKRVTMEAVNLVEQLKKRIEEFDPDPSQRPYYEHELSLIVDRWSQKIQKLGCEPRGLWMVDFDNGQGYYCWSFPEEDVRFMPSSTA